MAEEVKDPSAKEPTKRKAALDKRTEVQKTAGKAQKAVDALYLKWSKEPVFEDFMKVINSFADYHRKISQDGIAYKRLSSDRVEEITLDPTQRVGHLDKAAGIQEILDYIDRRLQSFKSE